MSTFRQLQEGEYTTILGWATDYRLSKGRLEILTARGEVLVFEPLPEGADASLEGTAWTLAAFIEEETVEGMVTPQPMPTDVLAETEITATFEDGTVSGSAGCNTYAAAYARACPEADAASVAEGACPEADAASVAEGACPELAEGACPELAEGIPPENQHLWGTAV